VERLSGLATVTIKDFLLAMSLGSGITLGLGALLVYLVRSWFEERLKRSIQHDYDKKLELLRSELRAEEEQRKAALKENNTTVDALLRRISEQNTMLDTRRVQAVERLWQEFIALRKLSGVVMVLASINFDKAAELAERDPRTREMFKAMMPNLEVPDMAVAEAQRPFLSALPSICFDAYFTCVAHSLMKAKMLTMGLNMKGAIEDKAVLVAMKKALPSRTQYIDEHGLRIMHLLLPEMQELLLYTLGTEIGADESDQTKVERLVAVPALVAEANQRLNIKTIPQELLAKDFNEKPVASPSAT
jgi:hypothetical protein